MEPETPFAPICLKNKPKTDAPLYSMVLQFNESIEDFYWFSEGLIIVTDPANGLRGFMDMQGSMLIEPRFKKAKPFFNGHATITMFNDAKERYFDGVIDRQGNLVIPYKYDGIGNFYEGYAIASEPVNAHDSRYFFIDTSGNEAINTRKYNQVANFSGGLAAVRHNGKWGFINTKGESVIPCKYNNVNYFKNGATWVVNTNNEMGIVNTQGEPITPFMRKKPASMIMDDLIMVESDKKYGYINIRGEEVIPCKYHDAKPFSNGLAAVMEGAYDNWCFINTEGNIVIEDFTDKKDYWWPSFSEGFSQIYRGGSIGFIDTRGGVVVPPGYSRAGKVHQGLVYVEDESVLWYGFLKMRNLS